MDLIKQEYEEKLENVKNKLFDIEMKSKKESSEWENKLTECQLDLTKALEDRTDKNQILKDLNSKLSQMSDYNELKKELTVMKSIQFSESIDTHDTFNTLQSDKGILSIEQLLVNKNKKLENETTELKRNVEEIQNQMESLESDIQEKVELISKQSQLILKLESDLVSSSNQGVLIPSNTSKEEDLNELLSGGLLKKSLSTHSGNNKDLIPILTSQRDRYRSKNDELQEEIRQHNSHIYRLETECNNLKTDNVKLYEKLRYIESFSGKRNSNSHFQSISMPISNSSNSYNSNSYGQDSHLLDKYEPLYEHTLDPFKRFHKQEEARSIRSMNPPDRFALSLTRIVISNRTARWIFISYLFGLHLLVFVTMYHWSAASFHHHELLSNKLLNDSSF